MKKFMIAALISAVSATSLAAGFGPVPPSVIGGAEQETSLFAGLNWTFGAGGQGVSARVGAIYTDTEGESVTGARTFFDYGLMDGSMRFAVTGLSGDTDHVGEFGIGYDFGGAEAFGLLGAMGDYSEIGAMYGFNSGNLDGYVGVNSNAFDAAEDELVCDEPLFPVLVGDECFDAK
jgi:hypothetical protein